jgi:glutamate formiminotransferase
MSNSEGVLWDAMRAALEVIEINRDGMQGTAAFNADVTPIINLAKAIVEQCAKVAEEVAEKQLDDYEARGAHAVVDEIRKMIPDEAR